MILTVEYVSGILLMIQGYFRNTIYVCRGPIDHDFWVSSVGGRFESQEGVMFTYTVYFLLFDPEDDIKSPK